jgi:hypothetical protein
VILNTSKYKTSDFYGWLKKRFRGIMMETRNWTCGFQEKQKIYWPAKRTLFTQEYIRLMELIEDGVILYWSARSVGIALFFEVLNNINGHLTPADCVNRDIQCFTSKGGENQEYGSNEDSDVLGWNVMSMVVTDIWKRAYCHFYFQSVEEQVAHWPRRRKQ